MTLTRQQLDQAQARLAYVQHPFPAQGTTTDTTHLIIAEHPTQEGTYVALTRARDHTHLYAATDPLDAEQPSLPQLAQRVSATDPDIPSIALPLAHERVIQADIQRATDAREATGRTDSRRADMKTARPELPDDTADPSQPGRTPDNAPVSNGRPAVIDAYRTRYAIADDDPRPLGPEPPAGAFRQRLHRRQAAHEALDAIERNDRGSDTQLRQLREAERPEPGRSTTDPRSNPNAEHHQIGSSVSAGYGPRKARVGQSQISRDNPNCMLGDDPRGRETEL